MLVTLTFPKIREVTGRQFTDLVTLLRVVTDQGILEIYFPSRLEAVRFAQQVTQALA